MDEYFYKFFHDAFTCSYLSGFSVFGMQLSGDYLSFCPQVHTPDQGIGIYKYHACDTFCGRSADGNPRDHGGVPRQNIYDGERYATILCSRGNQWNGR